MKIAVNMIEQVSDQIYRYQVLVNKKNQGFVRNYNYSENNNFWQIEDDKTKTNYTSKDEVVEAICAKNGRKLKK
jgi:hypothetical protein